MSERRKELAIKRIKENPKITPKRKATALKQCAKVKRNERNWI